MIVNYTKIFYKEQYIKLHHKITVEEYDSYSNIFKKNVFYIINKDVTTSVLLDNIIVNNVKLIIN